MMAKPKTSNRVALILPSGGDARKALHEAIRHLTPDGELSIVQTPGGQVPSAVSSWMIYLGFMGDRPSGDYEEVAMEEYHTRIRERLDDLQEMAEEHDVSSVVQILEGDTLKSVWKWVRRHHAEFIVLLRPEIIDPEREIFIQLADLLEKRAGATVYRV
jgi:hypothetical protein